MKSDYNLVEKNREGYPQKLKNHPNMPHTIYYKGNLPDPNKKTVAIVGSRSCSEYGKQMAIGFSRVLSMAGVQVISGLALGIDSYAHEGCLMGNSATFAVMGCGVNICFPKSNYPLYRKILENGGGIISEFEPDSPAYAYHFPIRNRIISGLADAVLIIEARMKSGSLITASYALEQGIQIYALPGRVNDSLSAGTNSLILQGAVPALSPDAILLDLGLIEKPIEKKNNENNKKALPKQEQDIYNILLKDPMSLDLICNELKLSIQIVSNALLSLELNGMIYQPSPGIYSPVP